MIEPKVQARRWRHPLFPVAAFTLFSLVVRENYPFSHFSMYSRPSARPLPFHYLADGEGRPLPVMKHTRITCAALGKKMGTAKGKLEKEAARHGGRPRPPEEIKAEAGRTVLADLRERSLKQPKRWQLPERLQLVEVLISIRNGQAHETPRAVAFLP